MFGAQSLWRELSGIEALADDPMRRPFEISTFYGNPPMPSIVHIVKRAHLKSVATRGANQRYWVGKSPYIPKRSRISLTESAHDFVDQKWPRITYAEALKSMGKIETEIVLRCRLDYATNIEAVSFQFPDALGRGNKKKGACDPYWARQCASKIWNIYRMDAAGCA